MTNQEKILVKIQKSETPVFLRQDFFDYPSSTLSKTVFKTLNKPDH